MALPDLKVRIGADTSQLDRAIGASQTQLRNFARNVAVTVGGALTFGLARDLLATTARLDNLSRLAGVSVERFQELSFGVRRFGVDQDKLADILKDVNDKFGDFAQTGQGPLADFFEKIAPKVGLTAQAFADLSSDQKLGAYVDALRAANLSQADMTFYMEALANDATILTQAFTDNGAAMQGMIDKARNLGLILDEDIIKKSRDANESLALMSEIISGKLAQALVQIAPLLTGTASAIETMARGANRIFNLTPQEQARELRIAIADIESQLADAEASRLRAEDLAEKGIPGQDQALARAEKDVKDLNAVYEELKKRLMEVSGGQPIEGGEVVDLGTINIPLEQTVETVKKIKDAAATVPPEMDNIKQSLNSVGLAAKNAFVNFVTGATSARQAVSQLLSSMASMFAERAFMSLFGNFKPFLTPAPSFAGGGFTGYGPRSGGMDGRGGFPAILHPNETVIDHTRGQSAGGVVRVIVEEAPGFASRVRTEATGVAVQVVQAGIQQYDRLVAPATQRRVAGDPRRVG